MEFDLYPAPYVLAKDLTHPELSPGFSAGDSYQYEVFGSPNQAVSYIQNGGPLTQLGQTDQNGYFILSGTELPAWVGHYTQTWFVGSTQASPGFDFMVTPSVQANNLTHPALAPDFLAGDTYQYIILGPPNQDVYMVQNSGSAQYFGQTDSSGSLVVSGVEQSAWAGSYTQIWTVGGQQANPSLSFVVDQASSGGTVTSTSGGQTPDGSVVGVSSITAGNGSVSTYSITELDYNASLYYDAETVATLYETGVTISQGSDLEYGAAGGSLTATATDWSDYMLQTDHYVVAYLIDGGYYENPLYFLGNGTYCDSETGDCSYWPGGGDFYIVAATLYLGSTISDQGAVPSDVTNVVLKDPDTSGKPGSLIYKITKWSASVAAAVTLGELEGKKHTDAPIPGYLDVIGDCQKPNIPHRFRTYLLRDSIGRSWRDENPVLVGENIIPYPGPGSIIGGGRWGTKGLADDKIQYGSFTDEIAQGAGYQIGKEIQEFWAKSFNNPYGLSFPPLDPVFGLTGTGTVPLTIHDGLTARQGIFSALDNEIGNSYISINGDLGQSPNKYYLIRNNEIQPGKQTCP